MPIDKVYLRHCLFYEFEKGNNASASSQNLYSVFRDNIVKSKIVCKLKKWRIQFKLWSGRPTKIDNEDLRREFEQNPYSTSATLGQMFHVSHSKILEHIQTLGFVLKYASGCHIT